MFGRFGIICYICTQIGCVPNSKNKLLNLNYMKKFFTMLLATVCGTMAYAQTGAVSVNDVTITKGGTSQVEIAINNAASKTAFQFDVALPTGVTIKEAKLNGTYGDSRHFENGTVDGKTRFLSYDDANAPLVAGEKVLITLEASSEAETATLTTDGIVVVDPEANSVGNDETATAAITVSDDVIITIGSSNATSYVSDDALDFTESDLSAYVVIGKVDNSLWLAKVKKVPAGTPLYVKASAAGDYPVSKTTLPNTYFKNFLIGNNSDAPISVTPEGSDQYLFLSTSGFSSFTAARNIGAHKAYARVPALPAANAGSAWPLSIGTAEKTTLCADVDLDFSDQADLKAYIVMGYEKGSLWLAPVKYASAGTPLYIKGPQGDYTITSTGVQTVYANMLVGNNSASPITIHPTEGDFTNLFLSSSGFSTFSADRNTGAHKSYLQVLTSYIPVSATTRGIDESLVFNEIIVDVERIILDGNEATAISRVAAEAGEDTWYNLNGQRIDTPTKKGLYIKNGKKVIVK